MLRVQKACDLIKAINSYKKGDKKDYQLITDVCGYFDFQKNEDLSKADLKFLKYISSIVGIPHFYDLLRDFDIDNTINDLDLNSVSCLIYEDTLYTSDKTKLHKFQKQILDYFEPKHKNRYFLSASTSFGKTHLVYEIINKMKYDNILLIFPTIALLSENYEKIISNRDYDFSNYKVHTLSDVDEISDKNIFIYTPERFLSYMEKDNLLKEFDFAFIDEIYKIDNEYIIDNTAKENERDVAYRLAAFYALQDDIDILLAGPYIEFSKNRNSFNEFLSRNEIELLDYNNYEIVNKVFKTVGGKENIEIDENLIIHFASKETGKFDRIARVANEIKNGKENCIVYCHSKAYVQKYAQAIMSISSVHNCERYLDFLEHIKNNFGEDWILYKSLKKGIGIHHGLVPKYIQKEIIRLFNDGYLDILVSTTTITEGVNTSAKNLLVTLAKKGNKELRKFDAKNIAGRAGRFLQHYTGRVIVFDNNFNKILGNEEEFIKHKNYDIESQKDDIDLFYTQNDFLSNQDKTKKENLQKKINESDLPLFIFNTYKVISCEDKIAMHASIKKLSNDFFAFEEIEKCIQATQAGYISYVGFQQVLDIILPIVKFKNLRFMIEYRGKENSWSYSLLTYLVSAYLTCGFRGSINYKLENQGKTLDEAINETADFVYNILKYHLVKYLGAFNIVYKYHISQREGINYEEVRGFDKLIAKFEYNAFSEKAKLASDYGSPHNIVEYYELLEDDPKKANIAKSRFDSYEQKMFENINHILIS